MRTRNKIDKGCVYSACLDKIFYELKYKIYSEGGHVGSGHSGYCSPDRKRYAFIPAPHDWVLDEMEKIFTHAGETHRTINSFLDVGCGIGNIMLLADVLGIRQVNGIEYDKDVLKYALFPVISMRERKWRTGIFHADALNFKHYDWYDFIYYYCPMLDDELEDKLEKKIQMEAKPGTYILSMYRDRVFSKQDFIKISELVWQKRGTV